MDAVLNHVTKNKFDVTLSENNVNKRKSKSYKKRMGKLSRKAKANFPGKISYVVTKERSNDKIWKNCFLCLRRE